MFPEVLRKEGVRFWGTDTFVNERLMKFIKLLTKAH